jgi:hypothetical protein
MVVQAGGSRNTYIGQITDWDTFTEAKLREDFGAYGEIEVRSLSLLLFFHRSLR